MNKKISSFLLVTSIILSFSLFFVSENIGSAQASENKILNVVQKILPKKEPKGIQFPDVVNDGIAQEEPKTNFFGKIIQVIASLVIGLVGLIVLATLIGTIINRKKFAPNNSVQSSGTASTSEALINFIRHRIKF